MELQTTEPTAQGATFKQPTAEQQAVLFGQFSEQLKPYQQAAAELAELGATKEAATKARELRLLVVKIRTGAAAMHKKAKEDALNYGRALDNAKKTISEDCEAVESELEAIEKAEQRAEAARIAAVVAHRREVCSVYCDPSDAMLANFSDAEFSDYLAGAKQRHENAQREIEAERQRIEAEQQAERERVAAQAAENARLKVEADKAAAEIAAHAKSLAEEKQARDREAREAQEREWAAKEAADRAAAAAAFAEKQRAAAEIAAKEQAAKIAAMEKAETERKAREAQAAAEREAQRLAEEKQRAKLQKAYTALATERERMIAAAGLLFDAPESEARTAAIWAIQKVVM